MRVMKILYTNTLEALSYESYEDLIYKYTWTFNPMRVMKILYSHRIKASSVFVYKIFIALIR
jgi:hypothetical protein